MNRVVLLTDTDNPAIGFPGKTYNVNEHGIEVIDTSHGVFVDMRTEQAAMEVFLRIRRHPGAALYLKPAYLVGNGNPAGKFLEALTDGIILKRAPGEEYIEAKASSMNAIQARCDSIAPEARTQTSALLKTLQWIFTRNGTIDALPLRSSRFGYTYPFIEAQFAREEFKMFEVLAYLEQHALLQARYVDRIHQCNKCLCSFLNFRETCPRCRSAYISIFDLVHHFTCGYMGPEPDYHTPNGLRCPKCKKALKHIGVDYDQPSIIYECRKCGNSFQQAYIDTICMDCQAIAEPKDLIKHEVKNYTLTVVGENAAKAGFQVSLANMLKAVTGALSNEAFEEVLRLEIERHKRYGRAEGTLGVLRLVNLQELYRQLGRNMTIITGEIVNFIQSITRPTDVLTVVDHSQVQFLFIETGLAGAEVIMQKLKQYIEKLQIPSIKLSPQIEYRVTLVNGKLTAKENMDGPAPHA
jgi:hypothetical protein